jgi:hypothetical protein
VRIVFRLVARYAGLTARDGGNAGNAGAMTSSVLRTYIRHSGRPVEPAPAKSKPGDYPESSGEKKRMLMCSAGFPPSRE